MFKRTKFKRWDFIEPLNMRTFSQIKYYYACIVMFYFISWTQETNLKTI